MKTKVNSYGKTSHVWNTGHEGHLADALPQGDPPLAWSFSCDGEALPGLVERRDRKINVDTTAIRRQRAEP